MKEEDAIRLESKDSRMTSWMFMIRLMCKVRPVDKVSVVEPRNRLQLNIMRECLQDRGLQ